MGVRATSGGFTLIELLIVISIMGILLSIGFVTIKNMEGFSNDQERADDTASIARRLEQVYTAQETGVPSYPSTTEFAAYFDSTRYTVATINEDALKSPGALSSSLVPATSADQSNPYNGMSPADYVYQPLKADGSLCTANPSKSPVTENCVRFFLYYKKEINNVMFTIRSLHQQ